MPANKEPADTLQETDSSGIGDDATSIPAWTSSISLFRDRVQTLFALSGQRIKLHVGLRIPSQDRLCGHADLMDRIMLFIPESSRQIGDTSSIRSVCLGSKV